MRRVWGDFSMPGVRMQTTMKSLAPPLQQIDRTYVWYRDRKLSYFGGCDYFRLSSHRLVVTALQLGLKRYGLTVAASRKTTGNHALYEKLEQRLADFFAVTDTVLLSNGYTTNLVVAQTLAGNFSHVLLDERAHASLVDAAVFFGCSILRFPSRDADALARLVRGIGPRSRPVLLTEGMFSHDGELAPIKAYLRVLPRNALVLLDDVHGAGVLGKTGKGTAEHLRVRSNRIIQSVSLGKAFGVYGGAVLGPRTLCERIRKRSRLFGGNTPLPLPLINAALQAVQIMKSDKSLRRRLEENTSYVKRGLRQAGLPLGGTPSPIIALTPRRAAGARKLSGHLLAQQVFGSFIRYPDSTARGSYRFAISSEHSIEQLELLVRTLSEHRDYILK